jgi:hypothetical protein
MPSVADGSPAILACQLDILAPKRRHREGHDDRNLKVIISRVKHPRNTKKSVIDNSSVEAPPCGSPLSTANFDPSEWEIMYLHFVEEGLIDPPDRARK